MVPSPGKGGSGRWVGKAGARSALIGFTARCRARRRSYKREELAARTADEVGDGHARVDAVGQLRGHELRGMGRGLGEQVE